MTARFPCRAVSQGFRHGIEKRRLQQHTYTLVLNTRSQLPSVRNMFTTLSVIYFFNESPKRRATLVVNLLTSCDTRFNQQHDSIMRFAEHFSDVLSVLQNIVEAVNVDAKT